MMPITEVEREGKKVLEYRFQPKLEDGTAIGGEQVVYGETHEELMDKAAENYNHLYRKNRELLRLEKLNGKPPEGSTPAPVETRFTPRALTAEERMKLARGITDPEKIDEVLDLALEAKFGAKPQAMAQSVDTNAKRAASIHAAQQAQAWRDEHPDFFTSEKNCRDLALWIENRGLEYTVANFNKAYEDLLPALETAPPSVTRTEPTPVPATADSRITAESRVTQRSAEVPSSVPRSTGTTRGAPVKKEGMTAEQFRKLPNQQRRDWLRQHPNGDFRTA